MGAAKFTLRAVATSLGLFGLLRLPWVEAHAVLPFTDAQATMAARLFGPPAAPIAATLACSGTDALALCLGAILAYPVAWRARWTGAAGATALILILNTVRIGTLGRAAASPEQFNTLHVYVWPAVLTVAIGAYVLAWMRLADRAPLPPSSSVASPPPRASRRFLLLAALLLGAFVAAGPLYLDSAWVLSIAGFIARAAATILAPLGIAANATDNVLFTSSGGYLVTQECISTPLLPVYLAAVFAYAPTRRHIALGVMAALPLFIVLGIARLMVVALPETIVSPLLLVHAFYQLVAGAALIIAAALWRYRDRVAARHALSGLVVGVLVTALLSPLSARLVAATSATSMPDPQRALAFLPAFQIGLYLALCAAAFLAVTWKRLLAGFVLLEATQVGVLLTLNALAASGITASVRDIRGWAVAGPVLILAVVANAGSTRR